MRFHLRPLGVRQYESFHPKLESHSSPRWNPDSQQALEHDPEKAAPDVIGGGNRFSEKIMLHNRLERDDDSKKVITL